MGTKNDRNTSGVYRAEALRLIQSRRIWILCGILWLYLMIQGTEIYWEVGARPGNHKRILAADCDTDIT